MEKDNLEIEEDIEEAKIVDGSVTRNTSYLTFALILQKIVSFTYFTLLARNLGPEKLGQYYFAISFTTIFSIIIDLGLVNVLTREVAKNKFAAKDLLGTITAIKLPLALFTILLIYLFAQIGGYTQEIKYLIYLSSLSVVLDSFTSAFFGVVRGFHNLIFESISSVIFQLIVMGFGLFFMYQGFSLPWIFSSLTMASAFNFIFSFLVLSKKIGVAIKPFFTARLIKEMILIALPFGIYAIFQRVYTYLDTVLLEHFSGALYVGYYQISFRIIFALQFLPGAFIASLYPAMSNYWVTNRRQLSISFEKALIYLAIISLPISAGIVALADKIILLFKSGYGEAVLPMQIIILSIFFIFINYPIGSLLNACDRQKNNTSNMIIITALSVIMNLILIPHWRAVGASITVLATNALMTILGFYWAKKTVNFDGRKIFFACGKIFLAAILMGLAAWYGKMLLNILLVIPGAVIIYVFLLFLFRTIGKDEV
ncbi:MAG TPA: flippase, partial [Candidatus Methylomirabilis sp.]|nr:flippase [Candidatus Methylomirabilis sp.]